ncbi:hypothetical protein ARMGADRAFT_180945 [Armillaria gallica]|uniref:Uncharacterized protein n=1 Tax=Armillaria gallica TaxID=47427 RepID=A0A2H3DAE6_ARMGA|nr:hypothetical protein ARMGADRAFT_180945 [Armillaria gallica]
MSSKKRNWIRQKERLDICMTMHPSGVCSVLQRSLRKGEITEILTFVQAVKCSCRVRATHYEWSWRRLHAL